MRARLDLLEQSHLRLREEFNARGRKVHDRNAEVQREFAEDYNRLNTELAVSKTQAAIHVESAKENSKKFEGFCEKVIERLTSIETVLASRAGGDRTKHQIAETILKLSGWASVIIAAVTIIKKL